MEAFNSLFPHNWISSSPSDNHHQQSIPQDSQPVHDDDWQKHDPSATLSDSYLTDIQAAPSSSAMTSAQALYQAYSPHMQYFPYSNLAYVQSAWPQQNLPLSSYSTLNGATNTIGQQQQNVQQDQQQQQQQQRQRSPPLQTMVIDPSLTLNGSSSASSHSSLQNQPTLQQVYHQYVQQQSLHQQPPLSINPMHVHSHSVSSQQSQQATLSPSALHAPSSSLMGGNMVFYHHPLSAPMQTNLTATSSSPPPSTPTTSLNSANNMNASPPPAPPISPQALAEKKRKFADSLRPLLAPNALTGAGAVRQIVTALEDYGTQELDAPLRTEIASRIRDCAGNHFFRAWAENADALEIFNKWLKNGFARKDEEQWRDTIMPILHVIDRLPLTVEQLRTIKVARTVVKIMRDPPTPAIKDMASNLEKKWRQMIPTEKKTSNGIEDKTKKRKLPETTTKGAATAPPPTKKLALSATPSSSSSGNSSAAASKIPLKNQAKVVTVKDAKSDSSFFSTPKPKAKLPSFKKAPPASSAGGAAGVVSSGAMGGVKREADIGVAQPSAIDPFQEALKSMGKGRNASPALSTPEPPTSASSSSATLGSSLTKSGRKRKSVTWAQGDQLEQIRIIEKAIYDDDVPSDGMQTHSIRDLERGEGAALHAHLFEEAIDWADPMTLDFLPDIQEIVERRALQSEEKNVQEEREKAALTALYMSAAQIPDSPSEPATQISVEEADSAVKLMLAGSDIQPFFAQAMSVSDLVGQLRGGASGAEVPEMSASSSFAADVVMANGVTALGQTTDLRGLGLDPQMLSALAAQLTMTANPSGDVGGQFDANAIAAAATTLWGYGQQQPQQQTPASQGYDQHGYDEQRERERDRDDRDGYGPRGGRGGWRGRGRGIGRGRGGSASGGGEFKSRRKPCTFYAQGRCKFGDACDFSHEQPPSFY